MQDTLSWCILFADDIILVDDTREEVNVKLKSCRKTLKIKGFRHNRVKIKHMDLSLVVLDVGR